MITIAIRLRSDYDISHVPASNSMQEKMNMSIFRHSHIVFILQLNRNCDIGLSSVLMAVECTMPKLYSNTNRKSHMRF